MISEILIQQICHKRNLNYSEIFLFVGYIIHVIVFYTREKVFDVRGLEDCSICVIGYIFVSELSSF